VKSAGLSVDFGFSGGFTETLTGGPRSDGWAGFANPIGGRQEPDKHVDSAAEGFRTWVRFPPPPPILKNEPDPTFGRVPIFPLTPHSRCYVAEWFRTASARPAVSGVQRPGR